MNMVRRSIQTFALRKVLGYLEANPGENLPKIIDWIDALDSTHYHGSAYRELRYYIKAPDNN